MSASRGLFSLKWKTLIGVSLVIIVAQTVVFLLVNSTLQTQYQEEAQQAFERSVRGLDALKESTAERLQTLAPTIAEMAWLANHQKKLTPKWVKNSFAPHWLTVNLDMRLESVVFYAADGELLGGWDVAFDLFDEEAQSEYAKSALKAERPSSALICSADCRQLVFVPLLTLAGEPYVMALSSSLEEIIIGFSQVMKTSLTFLSQESPNACCWERGIVAGSQRQLAETLLPIVAQQAENIHQLVNPVQLDHKGKTYSVRLTGLHAMSNGAAEIVIEDVTLGVERIQDTLQSLLLLSLFLVATTVLLLLFLLWRPMSELRKLAEGLPLLAAREYPRLRKLVGEKYLHTSVPDEIDVLDRATVMVSEKLEAMETDLRRHSDALQRRAGELSEERDFVQSLLNTAQVIIVTLDNKLMIRQVNDFGPKLLNISRADITDMPFSDFSISLRAEHVSQLEQVVSGELQRYEFESRVKGLKGKHYTIDWLVSPLGAEDSRILAVGLDVTERKQAEARLSWLADHDSLTGLFNRSRCTHELERILATAKENEPVCFMHIGLDDFKEINSLYGYSAGDSSLLKVAETLRELSWKQEAGSQWVVRLEGDEFAIILEETKVEHAEQLAHDVLNNFAKFGENTHLPAISASIGISVFPEHANTVRELMANADVARLSAKQSGGNRVVVFSEQELNQELVQNRLYWRTEIEQALRDNRFELFFQPIIGLKDNTIHHYECLLRMRSQENELVSPGLFMPVAEASNLIFSLERRVLELAITKLAELQEQRRDIHLAVNLSGRNFDRDELLTDIQELIKKHKINPKQLTFELTETAAVANLRQAKTFIQRLQALGAKIAFDDFGVGFTSFQYLKDLPVDIVKLDASFVQRVHREKDDQILVRSMVGLLQGLGKDIVAEGVEEKECYEWLRNAGVHYIQGYYIGKPKPEILDDTAITF